MQKKILLLSTGGTIASVMSDAGLVPKESGEQLINMLGELPYDITVEDILQLDSSNIQPEEWKLIAEKIYENRNKYDGIVVSHGTDTMSYTASMLAFMLQNINIPVVLTGSQVPINVVLSDAPNNLKLAFTCGLISVFKTVSPVFLGKFCSEKTNPSDVTRATGGTFTLSNASKLIVLTLTLLHPSITF